MLRTSGYTIFVDLGDDGAEVLLIHGFTGAYDKVSRRVADYLRAREGEPPRPLYGEWGQAGGEGSAPWEVEPPSPAVVDRLKDRGYLTALGPAAEEAVFSRIVERLHERALRQPPSYILMPTYDCNLRCSYCYQDALRADTSLRHRLRSMQPAMVDRIFAAIPRLEARCEAAVDAGSRRGVGLFGGEPLLAANRPLVERILDRAGELEGPCRFWAVTNGTELEAYSDLVGPGRIEELQITLDGPAAEHDRRRVDAAGGGSFQRIAANIDRALELGATVTVRLNVDRTNVGRLPELARELAGRGWQGHPRFSAYTSPVRPGNGKTEPRSTFSSWQLDRALRHLAREHPEVVPLARPDAALRERTRGIFDRRPGVRPALRPSFCGAHDRMLIFDPFGDLYACWEHTGNPQVRIGQVTADGDIAFRYDQLASWRRRTVASNPVCRRCRYALYCGGGCAVLALAARGKLDANYCDGFSSRFRASVAEAYQAHVAGGPPSVAPASPCDL